MGTKTTTTTMSQTEPTYVTETTYNFHRERQESAIRGEFGRQASLIEKGNKQSRNDLTTTFSDRISNVHGTLSGSIGELSDGVQVLKDEVHQVKDEVHQVKTRLDHIEGDVGEVRSSLLDFGVRLERMEKVRMNGTKSRLYEKIEMFGKIVPGVGYQMPRYVPKNAGEFWKLKGDVNTTSTRRLIYLVEFYNIDDYQHWHKTQFEEDMTSDPDDMQSDDEQSSLDLASSDLSLEESSSDCSREKINLWKRQSDRDCHCDPPQKFRNQPSPFLNSCGTKNPIRPNSMKHNSSMITPHQLPKHEPR